MLKRTTTKAAHIVIDWGTTSFRAFLVSADGALLDELETTRGIQFITDGAYENELTAAIENWTAVHGTLPIIALGMITSRNGWVEVPYVPCPVLPEDLAAGIIRKQLPNGCPLYFLPGITDRSRKPFSDVMRGEETQILGFGLDKDISIVLPGTHSKWARIKDRSIHSFQTFVTGEIFALLSQQSFIAKAAGETGGTINWEAFDRGLENATAASPESDATLSILFSARTGMLASEIQSHETRDYISGVLIGQEFRQAGLCGWFKKGDRIGIVGNDGLNQRYERAASNLGLQFERGSEEAAIHGALSIIQKCNL
jgi:2-dehydro-3-deoxygalactonokinase